MKHPSVKIFMAVSFLSAGMIAIFCVLAASSEKRQQGSSFAAPELRKAIRRIEKLHTKLARPGSGDWLASHPEEGQTFEEYLKFEPVTPGGKRSTIYFLPIGKFTRSQEKILDKTCKFMEVYYRLSVKKLDPVDDDIIPQKAVRCHPSWGMKQYLSTYILDKVLKPRLPEDGLVIFGITATDLWPGEGWNFVYGQASLRNRVSVQSICRNGDLDKGKAERLQYLRRTLKTATHEMGHVLSMLHCIKWECNMCGSNHREESDRHPMWMCPECVAKLCWAVRCDPVDRYLGLYRFCKREGLEKVADFYRKSYLVLGGSEQKLEGEVK